VKIEDNARTKIKKEYRKSKIDELGTNSIIKNTRDILGASVTLRMVTSLELI
jgi:hypothetical protein